MLGFTHFMTSQDLQNSLSTIRQMRASLQASEKRAFMPMPPDMQQMQGGQGGPPQGMPPGMDPSQMPGGMPPGGAPPQGMPPGMDPSA